MLRFLTVVVIALVGGVAANWVRQRISRHRPEGAIRLPGRRWQHGRLMVTPGVIGFESYRWQVRLQSGENRSIRVTGVDDWSGRPPSRREWWSINPDVRIIQLSTTDGVVEFAALPHRLAIVRTELHIDRG